MDTHRIAASFATFVAGAAFACGTHASSLGSPASASAPPSPGALPTSGSAAPAPSPTPSPVDALVGHWQGSGVFKFQDDTKTTEMDYRCERAPRGPAVVCGALITAPGMRLEETELVAFDKASGTYHLYSANNFGEAFDHAGPWNDPLRVSLRYSLPHDGKTTNETYSLEWKSKDDLVVRGVEDVDGAVVGDGTHTLHRAP